MRFFCILIAFGSFALELLGQGYTYSLSWLEPHTHTYRISAVVSPQTDSYTDFRVPSWRPGRYRLQDYSAAVSNPSAQDEAGQALTFYKIDKDTWRVEHGPLDKVHFQYDVFAANPDAGSSYLGEGFAYFNPVNMFVHVPGRMEEPVTLNVPELPKDWKVATQLKQVSRTRFTASSYHYFVDAPTVLGKQMKQLSFEDQGTTFYLHFHGDYQGDTEVDEALLDGVKRICRELGAIFGEGYPFEEYHFIYRLLPYRYRHAVEHTNSASFVLPSSVTSSPRALVGGVFGITAHEFFHAWNVKRIRPDALWPYDYSQPQYTRLHWFTEGVTDYYTNVALVRAGLIDRENFYRRMASTLDALDNNPSSRRVSPATQSFDSWFETSDYAHPFHQVSFYTSGSRLGFLIDLHLRNLTEGEKGLDDVFAYLFTTYYEQGRGVPEDGVQRALETLSNHSWEEFFASYVHGTQPIPYEKFLSPLGLTMERETDENSGPGRLGILRYNADGPSISVNRIHTAGDAYRDGLGQDDLILAVNGEPADGVDFDKVCSELKKGDKLRLQVFSGISPREVEITFKGSFVPFASTIREKQKNNTLLNSWLQSRNN